MTSDTLGPIAPGLQAAVIIETFSNWLAATPGRRIVLSHDDVTGWRCELQERRSTHGTSLRDATAQCAQVLALEA